MTNYSVQDTLLKRFYQRWPSSRVSKNFHQYLRSENFKIEEILGNLNNSSHTAITKNIKQIKKFKKPDKLVILRNNVMKIKDIKTFYKM